MAREKSAFIIELEYWPLRWIFSVLRGLPVRWAVQISQALLTAILYFMPRRKALIGENLALSFPELSTETRSRIGRDMVAHLARGLVTFVSIPKLAPGHFKTIVEPEGLEHVEAAKRLGKGILMFTAHYGCWEIVGAYVSSISSPGGFVVRPLDNPKLETLVRRVRAYTGGEVIGRRRIFRDGIKILRQNGTLGLVIDQNFSDGGLFVDFFGRPAATTSVMSLLARRTGAVVIPVHAVWEGEKIKMIFSPPVPLSQAEDPILARAEDTQRVTAIIEGWVREHPEQWLWLHNRWKRRPQPGDYIYSSKENTLSAV